MSYEVRFSAEAEGQFKNLCNRLSTSVVERIGPQLDLLGRLPLLGRRIRGVLGDRMVYSFTIPEGDNSHIFLFTYEYSPDETSLIITSLGYGLDQPDDS